MKKAVISLSVLCLLGTVSCKKKDDIGGSVPSSEVPSTLMGKKWQLTAATFIYGGVETDGYTSQPTCKKDNTWNMKSDNTNEIDEGASKCNSSDPQTSISGKWELRSGNTQIYVSGFSAVAGIDALTMTITSLTSSTLKVKYITTVGGPSIETNATYTAR